MFDFIRTHKKIMQILLIILIFPSFVLFGIDGYKSYQDQGETVATVDGFKITTQEWEQAHKVEVDRMRASMPGSASMATPPIPFPRWPIQSPRRPRCSASTSSRCMTSPMR